MNSRINELAVKTDAWCDQNHFGKSDYDLQWEAKFAELIVEECAETFTKIWYEQGLDIRGADLAKFMKRFMEFNSIYRLDK